MPKVWIDENVLQKDSPIYQNGQYLVYQGALTLKEEVRWQKCQLLLCSGR